MHQYITNPQAETGKIVPVQDDLIVTNVFADWTMVLKMAHDITSDMAPLWRGFQCVKYVLSPVEIDSAYM